MNWIIQGQIRYFMCTHTILFLQNPYNIDDKNKIKFNRSAYMHKRIIHYLKYLNFNDVTQFYFCT